MSAPVERDYTTSEAARLIGCGPAQVRKLIDTGRFPGTYRIGAGRHRRIPEKALREFLRLIGREHVLGDGNA